MLTNGSFKPNCFDFSIETLTARLETFNFFFTVNLSLSLATYLAYGKGSVGISAMCILRMTGILKTFYDLQDLSLSLHLSPSLSLQVFTFPSECVCVCVPHLISLSRKSKGFLSVSVSYASFIFNVCLSA